MNFMELHSFYRTFTASIAAVQIFVFCLSPVLFLFVFVHSLCLALLVKAHRGHQSYVLLIVTNSVFFLKECCNVMLLLWFDPLLENVQRSGYGAFVTIFFSRRSYGGQGSGHFSLNQLQMKRDTRVQIRGAFLALKYIWSLQDLGTRSNKLGSN